MVKCQMCKEKIKSVCFVNRKSLCRKCWFAERNRINGKNYYDKRLFKIWLSL